MLASYFFVASLSAMVGLPAVVELSWCYWHTYNTVTGNPAVASVSAVAKGQVSTLFPVSHMVMDLFQKETSLSE